MKKVILAVVMAVCLGSATSFATNNGGHGGNGGQGGNGGNGGQGGNGGVGNGGVAYGNVLNGNGGNNTANGGTSNVGNGFGNFSPSASATIQRGAVQNDVDVKNTNVNVNSNKQQQGQQQKQTATNNGGVVGSNNPVTINEPAPYIPVSSAIGMFAVSPRTCMGGSYAAGQGPGFGLSLGTSWHDLHCEEIVEIETAAILDKEAGIQRACAMGGKMRSSLEAAGHVCKVADPDAKPVAVANPTVKAAGKDVKAGRS